MNMRTSRTLAFAILTFLTPLVAQTSNVDRLVSDLRNGDHVTRIKAIMELSQIAGKDPKPLISGVEVFAVTALDRDLNLRWYAIEILKKIGPDAKRAIPSLIAALNTYPQSPPQLDGPLRYYADVRVSAAEALGAMGPEASSAIPKLKQMRNDPSEYVREAAVAALKQIENR